MLEEIDPNPLMAVTGGAVTFKDDESRKTLMDALQSLITALATAQSTANDWFVKFLPMLMDMKKGKDGDGKTAAPLPLPDAPQLVELLACTSVQPPPFNCSSRL